MTRKTGKQRFFPDIFYHFKCPISFITSEHYNSDEHCYAISIDSIPTKEADVSDSIHLYNDLTSHKKTKLI